MSVITSDQSKLVLNAFAAGFENNLVSRQFCEWNTYDREFDPRNRLDVSEQVDPGYVVRRTTGAVADLTAGVQSSVFGSERFVVDRVYTVDMGWADFVKIRDVGSARESRALRSATMKLAEQIDADAMTVAALASNNWTGTAGNNIATYNDFAAGVTRFMEEGVNLNDLYGVLAPVDRQVLGNYLVGLPATDGLATNAFRSGFRGEIDGVPTMFTQQLPVLTVGTRGGAASLNGAAQNVNYRAVAVSPAQGQYMTQTISLDGLVSGHTIAAGEVFTIAGVFAYDNRKQGPVAPARLQQFTVVTGGTATGAGAIAALRVFPAIIVPNTGADANIQRENSAHATVTAAPANDAPITFLGAASAALLPRMIIQKGAIVASTVPLAMPDSDTASRRTLSKIPLSVRMWKWSDGATGAHNVRFDVAVNFNIRNRQRIVRINGA
jgi:hypothetical protein